MRKTIVMAASVAALLFTASAASAQVCVLGIFVAAATVGAQQHRELTSEEAMSCGLATLFEKPKPPEKEKPKARHKTKEPQ